VPDPSTIAAKTPIAIGMRMPFVLPARTGPSCCSTAKNKTGAAGCQ